MKINKKILILVLAISLILSGCGKQRTKKGIDDSRLYLNYLFTEEGILYRNPNPPQKGILEYFDYYSQNYMPLCDKANCLHNNMECMAVYLNSADIIGRLENQWYYLLPSKKSGHTFYSCDLNGQNEKKIGDFPYEIEPTNAIFFDHSCVLVTFDISFDQGSGARDDDVWTNTVYQYHFDTGETEILCPEIENGRYNLCGRYENIVVYREQVEDKYILKTIDLESKEVIEPLKDMNVIHSASMFDNILACVVWENDIYKIIELDVVSGKWKEIMSDKERGAKLFWNSEMKIMTQFEEHEGEIFYKTYQYLDNGESILIREGKESAYFEVLAMKNGLLVGRYGGDDLIDEQFNLAMIREDDFLAGMSNWMVLRYD